MNYIKVVAAVIFRENKILIARRKKGKHLESCWEYPGGKTEKNEEEKKALKRELKEEFNIEASIEKYLTESFHEYENININLKAYLVRDFLYHKQDIPVGTVVSPTEKMNKYFSHFVPPIFIHEEYTPRLVSNVLKRQSDIIRKKQSGEYGEDVDERAFLIFDDCSEAQAPIWLPLSLVEK